MPQSSKSFFYLNEPNNTIESLFNKILINLWG